MFSSDRKSKELVLNLILAALVLVAWGYVIAAGRVVSERYLSRLDLSQFLDERERRALHLLPQREGEL